MKIQIYKLLIAVTDLDLKLSVVTFTQNLFVSERKEPNLIQCLKHKN